MATYCDSIPDNLTFDCQTPWGEGCVSRNGFNFPGLWTITQKIQASCANDTRLFGTNIALATAQNASMTEGVCEVIAGKSWTYYPGADIWTRLTTWKFPLLQLVASFPRPPLSFWVEMFVVNHLLGSPIDTMKNLLAKMSSCQSSATHWRQEHEIMLGGSPLDTIDRDWKSFAIIADAYVEYGVGDLADEFLQHLKDCPDKLSPIKTIWQTGDALAADRATKTVPVVVAQCVFIASVGIAIFRTAAAADSATSSDAVFINVEAHSIAFSALYFWIIPAVFLGSIIGVSQTENAIPRILRRFESDLINSGLLTGSIEGKLVALNHHLEYKQTRIYHGGIYSWQPSRWQSSPNSTSRSQSFHWLSQHKVLPYFIVALGSATGMTVSALVPPDGIDCRHVAQTAMFIIWLVSAELDIFLPKIFPLQAGQHKILFWSTYAKDLIATGCTMGCVIATQVGLFNRCACYTQWGRTGLALPEMPDVAAVLRARLGREYPAITFTSIAIELLIIPLAIWLWYGDAVRVFVQRDDAKSNAMWLWRLCETLRRFKAALKKTLHRLCKLRMSRRK